MTEKTHRLKKALRIPLTVLLVLALLFCPMKRAVKVTFNDKTYDIRDFEGQFVRLLCKYQDANDSMWYAKYIEVDNGVFAELSPGTDISFDSWGVPNLCGEYTSNRYAKTEIILEGTIPAVFEGYGGASESYMRITNWDVVHPFDPGWFDRKGYLKNHLILLDLMMPKP